MLAKRVSVLFVLAAAWLVTARPAYSESSLLVLGGNAAEHERTTVGGAVEAAIRSSGWTLSPKPLSKKESDGLLKCPDSKSPWTCIPASPGTRGVLGAFVVSVDQIQNDSGVPVVVVTGRMIMTDPPSFAVRERYCERCADDKLAEAGEDVIVQLTRELAKRSGRTVVVIKSVPSSATLILDGERVGGTDATFPTFPGKHTAMVEKPGYISEVREFTVAEGKTAEITLTLRASALAESKPPTKTPERSIRVPVAVIGAGSVLTLFGVVSLYQGQRDDPKFDYARATQVGIATGAIGLATVGVGIYLLQRKPAQSVPTASVSPGGVTVGWAGRF